MSGKSAVRLLVLLAVIFAPRAEACSCMARLRSTTLTPHEQFSNMTHEEAQFVVIEVLRGEMFLGQPIFVKQDIGSGACAMSSTNNPTWIEEVVKPAVGDEDPVFGPTKLSKDWLIYSAGPGPYELNSCTRTTPINIWGAEDLKLLREFVKHPPKWPLAKPNYHD